jgi:ribosomal protein S18 acetylase RimI-like enzyme
MPTTRQGQSRAAAVPTTSRITLRDYRHSDFESIWALDQECFPPAIAYSRSDLRAFLSLTRAETIVAEGEGRIVAFVLGSRRRHADGHVITLDVAAGVRRHGVGRRLLVELEGRFRAAGVRRVRLETAVTNTSAIAFYEGLGYQKVAHLAGYYGPGMHAWRMQKPLPPSGDSPATGRVGGQARRLR